METKEEMIYAGFWVRVLAAVIDGLVLAIPTMIVNELFGEDSWISIILLLILWWQYSARMLSSSWRATIGKKIVSIAVVNEMGEQITFKDATFRFLYSLISYLLLLPILMMLFTEKKQTLHDKMAKTLVIDVAQMSDVSSENNAKFIRVIGYIILAIIGAVQVYTIGLMVFFYLLMTNAESRNNNIPNAITLPDYNYTKSVSDVNTSTKNMETKGGENKQSSLPKIYSEEEERIWDTAKNGGVYGVGYYENKNLNFQNENGQTPLMIAVSHGHDSVVQGFSEGVLDVSIQDNEGRTAYDYIKKPKNRNEELQTNRLKGALKMAETTQIFKNKAYIAAMGYKNATGLITVSIRNAYCSDFELPEYIKCKD